MLRKTADICIVGGGILGSACAYYLSKETSQKVILFEREAIACATSSRAAGFITLARTDANLINIVRETFSAISALEESLQEDLGMVQSGSLYIASSQAGKDRLKTTVDLTNSAGIATKSVSCESIQQKFPWLKLSGHEEIIFNPEDAIIDCYRVAQAYTKAAKQNGVEICTGVSVENIVTRQNRVAGLETSEGMVSAPVVINAAGAWANLLTKPLGIGLPMAPVRSQFWLTESPGYFEPEHPYIIMPDARAYMRYEPGGFLFGIREKKPTYYNPMSLSTETHRLKLSSDPLGLDVLIDGTQALQDVFPDLENLGISHFVPGLSTYTPDGRFIIGHSEQVEGLYSVSGCCGAGLAISGGAAKVISELINHHPLSFDISSYRPERLGKIDPFSEDFMASCTSPPPKKK
jgi:glycine/D-amino acid oxidase-like deaminating enzyme